MCQHAAGCKSPTAWGKLVGFQGKRCNETDVEVESNLNFPIAVTSENTLGIKEEKKDRHLACLAPVYQRFFTHRSRGKMTAMTIHPDTTTEALEVETEALEVELEAFRRMPPEERIHKVCRLSAELRTSVERCLADPLSIAQNI